MECSSSVSNKHTVDYALLDEMHGTKTWISRGRTQLFLYSCPSEAIYLSNKLIIVLVRDRTNRVRKYVKYLDL